MCSDDGVEVKSNERGKPTDTAHMTGNALPHTLRSKREKFFVESVARGNEWMIIVHFHGFFSLPLLSVLVILLPRRIAVAAPAIA